MHLQGVPIVVVSAWLRHADPAFTMLTHVHSQNDALKIAVAKLKVLRGSSACRDSWFSVADAAMVRRCVSGCPARGALRGAHCQD